ncbi:MAG: hypothetical protein EHM73_06595 [Chroococcales cyanobacterium metabat2.561]|uniref:Uncharacterized protein n=1 Tax=Microcystis aeruginosa Ma_SC_T_19800800_S464 TaxID=2486257 RepID=A0A552DVZ4_MICAE|nr:MAG: hypothetical protein EHM73_06595 [Chroococcales cyanobacterium metabat2.561]TRU26408.1 MAG: hypothetical protein EWV81_10300 [Microcystis aeruginosa Ma_SC_T_19800800_S464]
MKLIYKLIYKLIDRLSWNKKLLLAKLLKVLSSRMFRLSKGIEYYGGKVESSGGKAKSWIAKNSGQCRLAIC